MTIEFATAKAGHDKKHVYCVIRKEADWVYLVNGTTRKLDHPKKKNVKHIQIIKKLPIEIGKMCQEIGQTYSDEGIRKAIDCYQQSRIN